MSTERKYQENHGKYSNELGNCDPVVMTPTVSSNPPEDPRTHEEARQFHEGFLAGATAYAAAVGHSTLKSDNPKLCEVFDAQGWKTIETFERIGAREADTCPDCGRSWSKKECQCA
jgi:hypothetical protein